MTSTFTVPKFMWHLCHRYHHHHLLPFRRPSSSSSSSSNGKTSGTRLQFLFHLLLLLFLILVQEEQVVVAKEIDSHTDLLQEETRAGYMAIQPSNPSSSNVIPPDGNDLWPSGRGDMPQIKNLNVKCEKNHMKVNLEFDRPFYGTIFSKGHFSDAKCIHLAAGTGHVMVNFDIFLGACGMTSSETGVTAPGQGSGLFIENTIIVQYDGQVQEIWDQARRLRCTWYDFYEKAVTFKVFSVEMQDAVTANFLGDNIQCWMQIQAGKGPWASEVAGIVKIGQTMTMVLAIKDDENKFDMLVRNCLAHDGKHQPIQLVDDSGCVIRPKIMSKFHKVKNFGASATVVSYAYFQAFKFPDSMNVHFQCVIQVCRHECPEPSCEGGRSGDGYNPRDKDREPAESNRLVSVGNRAPGHMHLPRAPVYRPAPPSPSPVFNHHHFVHRTGDLNTTLPSETTSSPRSDNLGAKVSIASSSSKTPYMISAIQRSGMGSPRSLPISRTKRTSGLESELMDIKTREKVIQVVAPGDMAFSSLSEVDENEVNTSIAQEFISNNSNSDSLVSEVCIQTTSLIVGSVLLFLLLVVSILVSFFLYLRIRQVGKVTYVFNEASIMYDGSPEFMSYPGIVGMTH